VIKLLEASAEIIPAPVNWVDIDNVVLGANKPALKSIGASSFDEIVGKTPYDLFPEDLAQAIVKNNDDPTW
jgi:hypothetical protein